MRQKERCEEGKGNRGAVGGGGERRVKEVRWKGGIDSYGGGGGERRVKEVRWKGGIDSYGH